MLPLSQDRIPERERTRRRRRSLLGAVPSVGGHLLALAQHYGQTAASGSNVAAVLDPLFLKLRRRR